MSSAYIVGRPARPLAAPFKGSDALFAADRLDGQKLARPTFEHCTFANVSFKECEIDSGQFVNCQFIGCYFRRATLRNTSFQACRFVDCDFPKTRIVGCDFRYAHFSACFIESGEMRASLPAEPNIREELAMSLSRGAEVLAHTRQARTYRLIAIEAREEHHRNAILGTSDWYRQHFPGIRRLGVLVAYIAGQLNRLIWGYGEKGWVLARNLLFAALLIFPGVFWLVRGGLGSRSTLSYGDYFALSWAYLLPGGVTSPVTLTSTSARFVAGSASLIGYLFLALFVAILLKAVTRR